MHQLQFAPLARGLAFGARINGPIDLKRLTDEEFRQIYDAFLDYGVLVVPGQTLNQEEQMELAQKFGKLELPNLQISNVKKDGTAAPGTAHYFNLKGNEGWHTDSTYMPLSSKAAMLYAPSADTLPREGGETAFADMRHAYEQLDGKEKARIANLAAYHR